MYRSKTHPITIQINQDMRFSFISTDSILCYIAIRFIHQTTAKRCAHSLTPAQYDLDRADKWSGGGLVIALICGKVDGFVERGGGGLECCEFTDGDVLVAMHKYSSMQIISQCFIMRLFSSIMRFSSSISRSSSACSTALICASCFSTMDRLNPSRLRAPQHHRIPQIITSKTNRPNKMPPPLM